MKGFIALGASLTVLCGCETVERKPEAVFEGITPGMSQDEFLEALPQQVELVHRAPEFITIRYPVEDEKEMQVSHIWFLEGGLKNVPGK